MFRLALITSLTLALLSPPQQQSRSAADAPRFVSLEGRFSVSLPDRYKKLTRPTFPIPGGEAYGKLYEWQINKVTYGVGYYDYFSKPIEGPEGVKRFFDLATEQFKKNAASGNGYNTVVKKIMLHEYPGIEHRADLGQGSFIQRTYLVARRIYETLVVVTNSQRDESTAVSVLDSFKLLNDAEITEEALKAPPTLPQTPVTPRAGSDAGDEGLRGPVKSVRVEIRYESETPLTREEMQSWLTTYNEKGNILRTESYDFKNNLQAITAYGYLDGHRVSAFKFIQRGYGPAPGIGAGIGRAGSFSNRKMDPRYQHRFEFKYDEKKRLTEKTDFMSNGDFLERRVYKYDGNKKEELVYSGDGSLIRRYLYTLDDKGNEIEQTFFKDDGSPDWKNLYKFEFDSNGNWTKRTVSRDIISDRLRKPIPRSVHLRTITYY